MKSLLIFRSIQKRQRSIDVRLMFDRRKVRNAHHWLHAIVVYPAACPDVFLRKNKGTYANNSRTRRAAAVVVAYSRRRVNEN